LASLLLLRMTGFDAAEIAWSSVIAGERAADEGEEWAMCEDGSVEGWASRPPSPADWMRGESIAICNVPPISGVCQAVLAPDVWPSSSSLSSCESTTAGTLDGPASAAVVVVEEEEATALPGETLSMLGKAAARTRYGAKLAFRAAAVQDDEDPDEEVERG